MLQRPTFPTSGPFSSVPPFNGVTAMTGGGAPVSIIDISIQRLEEVVEQETAALRSGQQVDLKGFNDRKNQALLELTRWMRNISGVGANPELAARIAGLKEKLAVNQAVLSLHLEAVREISTSMSDAIQQSESDGTYTQAISSAAARRYYD